MLLIHTKTPAIKRANGLKRKQTIDKTGYRVIEQCECMWNQQMRIDTKSKIFFKKFDRLP